MRDSGNPVLLDPSVLDVLGAEIECPSATADFLRTYLELLPNRLKRIASAVEDQDLERALEAVLSLKVTSTMVGALRMEQQCRDLELELRGGLWERTSRTASGLVSGSGPLTVAAIALLEAQHFRSPAGRALGRHRSAMTMA
ncbi:MAG: histidine phosphotransfer protein HptB [Actinomycetota bacterium]|nr:histidine phosphotransfer protein HptB [Actinomycetota bacterium]